MNNSVTVQAATIITVYTVVSLFCAYMVIHNPHARPRVLNGSNWSTEPLRMTLADSVKEVEYRKTRARWNIFHTHGGTIDMVQSFYNSKGETVQHFERERVERTKIKQYYAENSKGTFNSLKRYLSVPEYFSFLARKISRTSIPSTHSRQGNAYDQLINFITMPAFPSMLSDALPPPLHPSPGSPSFTTSSSTFFKCSYAASSFSTCMKSIKHCVKPSIALKTDLQFATDRTQGLGYLNVKNRVGVDTANGKPFTSGCPEVTRGQAGRVTKREGNGLKRNELGGNIHENVCSERWKVWIPQQGDEEVDREESIAGTHISLTIDAHRSFNQEVNGLHLSPRLSLQLLFNLVGFNSLHKHAVIASLLQVLQRLLARPGYRLVGSSANSTALSQYLQQEGLQPPLTVVTLWRRPYCDCKCP